MCVAVTPFKLIKCRLFTFRDLSALVEESSLPWTLTAISEFSFRYAAVTTRPPNGALQRRQGVHRSHRSEEDRGCRRLVWCQRPTKTKAVSRSVGSEGTPYVQLVITWSVLTICAPSRRLAEFNPKCRSATCTDDARRSDASERASAIIMPIEFSEDLISQGGGMPALSNFSSCSPLSGNSPERCKSWLLDTSTMDEQTSSVFDGLFVNIPVSCPPTPPTPLDQRAFPNLQLSAFVALWDNGAI